MNIQFRDISFYVDDSQHAAFWDYLSSGKWESDSFNILDDFVTEGSCFVDLGCWIGPLSLYAAAKGANVHAIDPDPEAYKWFLKNVERNPILKSRIKAHHMAISNRNGEQILYARTDYGNSSTSLLNRIRDGVHHVTTPVATLKYFLEKNDLDSIDLLKIDIEGGEFTIANQLEELKKRKKIKNLFLSIHYDHLNEAVYQKRMKSRFFSLVCMKLERLFGIYLFKKELLNHLKDIVSLAKTFNFIYTNNGYQLSSTQEIGRYLLKNKIDIVLSDREWHH